ncbi:hypothetical protein Tco_0681476 [Tanacetum coccineum]|uniref:Uncharacterized protein n=1 Tax=Tanacetum coccineum TaxID=301880 RepID=A0ABQ4XQ40_9ASTR
MYIWFPEPVFTGVLSVDDEVVIRNPATTPFLSEEVVRRVLALPTPHITSLSILSSPLSRYLSAITYTTTPQFIPLLMLSCTAPCRYSPGPGYEVGESSAAGTARQVGPTTASADFMDLLIQDEIIYSQLDDDGYDRALLRARVNMLESDRPFHTHSEGILLRTTIMTQQSEVRGVKREAVQRRTNQTQQDLLWNPASMSLPEEASSSS